MANTNTYVGMYNELKQLPHLLHKRNHFIKDKQISYLAKDSKLYSKSGETVLPEDFSPDKFKLTEEYFKKLKGFTWYSEQPFYKKISETGKDSLVKVTRTNGKTSSSLTNYDINGIRTTKITQKYNPETKEYNYARISYNDKGTKPQIVSSWKGEYTPLDELNK